MSERLFIIVVSAALLGAITTGGAAAIHIRARKLRGDLARCGRCGYAVAALTRMVCPECGSDLRDVGIVPASKGALQMFLLLAIPSTFLLMLFALISVCLVAILLTYLIGARTTWEEDILLRWTPWTVMFRVEVHGLSYRSETSAIANSITKQRLRTTQGISSTLTVNPARGECSYESRNGKLVTKAGKLDANLIVEWLSANGRKPAKPKWGVERAKAVVELVDRMTSAAGGRGQLRVPDPEQEGKYLAQAAYYRRDMRFWSPRGWYLPAATTFWFIIWLAWLIFLHRKIRAGAFSSSCSQSLRGQDGFAPSPAASNKRMEPDRPNCSACGGRP